MPAKQSRDGPLVCRVAPRGTTSLKLFLVASGLQDLAHAARRPARRKARGWDGRGRGWERGGGVRACSWRGAAHGHTRCMKALLVSHSPALVHPLQLSSWSLHTVVHTCAVRRVTPQPVPAASRRGAAARRRGGVALGGAGRGAAHPARVRALLHHRERVVDALARIGPDLTLRRVLVGALDALAHAAAVGALLVPAGRHAGRSARTARKGWEKACAVALA